MDRVWEREIPYLPSLLSCPRALMEMANTRNKTTDNDEGKIMSTSWRIYFK
jgi:hypothetical protein